MKTLSRFCLAWLLCLLVPLVPVALHADAGQEGHCGDKIKKKEVTVYEMELTYAEKAIEEVEKEHGVHLQEVAVETLQADRNIVKEARVQAAQRGCPYAIVGQQEERVVSIRYEASRAGSASLPVENKVFRALVMFAEEAAAGGAPEGDGGD